MEQTITTTPKKRIEYIDALRGFTMILVVFSHVELFSFGFGSPSLLGDLIVSFFMPLFFFVSGFIGYKSSIEWNFRTWKKMIQSKFSSLLIPTFVLGLIYTYVYLHSDISSFFAHNLKLGYWFTIVLFEMFLIVYTLNLFLYNSNPEIFKRRQLIAIVLISILMFGAKFILRMSPVLDEWGNILSLHNTFRYFPYLAFGYICSMHKTLFEKIIQNKYFAFVVISLFVLLFYVHYSYISPNAANGLALRTLDLIVGIIVGFLGLLIVYNSFRIYQGSFTSDKKIGRALQYIGKRTLDIYLLHYFFLPHLPQIGEYLLRGNNSTLELALGGSLSLIIIAICLIVSGVLRTSPILSKYLFGVKIL